MSLLIMMTMVDVERSRIGKASSHEQEAHAEHESRKRLCESGLPHLGQLRIQQFSNFDDLCRQASCSFARCLRTGAHRCNILLPAHWHSVMANSQWSFRFC